MDPSDRSKRRYWDGERWGKQWTEEDTAFWRTRITTLDHLPGHRIAYVLGLVSAVSSTSSGYAQSKGEAAFDTALGMFSVQALALRANAVVGVKVAAFAARGSLTLLGGDAVGALLVGTAVLVEPEGTDQRSSAC